MANSRAQAEAEVRSWGFKHVFTWTDSPNTHYPPHSHSAPTTHLLLSGTLTMHYPSDPNSRETLTAGARWDVPARKEHEVWVGEGGCTYVIGE